MKKNRFLIVFSLVCVLFAAFSLSVFADENAPTKQKISVSYNEHTKTVDLEYYIASETAIVGYCNFDYDSSVLSLLDKDGKIVPVNVPMHSSDGSSASYITDVISVYNNIMVTDVGRGADKLINTAEGYIFYAWMLPSNYPFIDATQDEMLISKISFKLKDGVLPEDLTEDCIKVATKELTEKVSGWYAGLVVMNKSQKRSTYSGEGENKALFEAVYDLPKALENGEDQEPAEDEQPKPIEDEKPTEDEKPIEDEQPAEDEKPIEDEQPAEDEEPIESENPAEEEQPTEDENPIEDETPAEDEQPTEDEDPVQDTQPEVNDNPKPVVIGSAKCAKTYDFNITVNGGTDSLRVKWEKPDSIGDVSSYTLVITDSEFYTVREIGGISGLSTSYTVSGLMSGYDYNIYIIASTIGSYVTSYVERAHTDDEGKYPETLVSNVFYNEGDGHLFGLSSELLLFGGYPSKVPTVIPEDGKYFIGWTIDGETIVDPSATRLYTDTLFSAVYSDNKPSDSQRYINGYEDGTFNPAGNITRAEAATIISRLSEDFDSTKNYVHDFTDCEEGYWYEKPVAFCQSKGYIKGYEDGTFNPYGNITRAEFATVLFRVFGFDGTLGINVFEDLDGHWGKDNICVLFGAGIVKPDKDGNFRPDEKLTREDAVIMINRCLGTVPDREAILEYVKNMGYRFSDVPQYSEAFYDIMAAVIN